LGGAEKNQPSRLIIKIQGVKTDMDKLWESPPFSMNKSEKSEYYAKKLAYLTKKHSDGCNLYKNLIKNFGFSLNKCYAPEEYPFLPVRLFKDYDLLSVDKSEIVKTMTSSGTTGQRVSKIFLDRATSANQTKALVKITSEFLGKSRLPMLIIDSRKIVKDRRLFSARGAGILGFSMLGHDLTYALDENMEPDIETVKNFLDKHKEENIFLFGFTYIIWVHFYKKLLELNEKIDLSKGILLHGGGFKKLRDEAVDNETYKSELNRVFKIEKVYNYYGMVEQTGSIFMECEHGRLHASNFSDVFIRNPKDFSLCGNGEKGLIQLVSVLPESYPGHSILTEDIGELTGEDDCPCGRYGKTFKIHGRIKQAEVRGCSDTYEQK